MNGRPNKFKRCVVKPNEAIKLLGDKELLDKIYRFSYHRSNNSHDAEELSSDIILTVLSAVHKQKSIDNFYAFLWTAARRVYADTCERREKRRRVVSIENADITLMSENNGIEEFIDRAYEEEQLGRIFKELTFLSRAYREVMIMYYIDGLSIRDIALRLGVGENTVKQRLFYARNSVRKEVTSMNERNYVLKPITLMFYGMGNPIGNDPSEEAERMLSQNLIYLCKDKPMSAKELSDKLGVPMPFIENELEIQCRGSNGEYGLLRKLDNGRYTVNFHLVDYAQYDEANKIYEKRLPELCSVLKAGFEKIELLDFPYLSEQTDMRFIMWTLLPRIIWRLLGKVSDKVSKKYFPDITPLQREYYVAAVANTDGQQHELEVYGNDGISASSVGEYKNVFIDNLYGRRIEKHFTCGHNLSNDSKLLMLLRCVNGLSVDKLSEQEKETAAKAVECGYLSCKDGILKPKILVLDKKYVNKFFELGYELIDNAEAENIVEGIAAELAEHVSKYVPEHLIDEYKTYLDLIAGARLVHNAVEACLSEGLLSIPEAPIGAEGVLMVLEK